MIEYVKEAGWLRDWTHKRYEFWVPVLVYQTRPSLTLLVSEEWSSLIDKDKFESDIMK